MTLVIAPVVLLALFLSWKVCRTFIPARRLASLVMILATCHTCLPWQAYGPALIRPSPPRIKPLPRDPDEPELQLESTPA